MDDTQGSRMSDAVATRKRRSSILKNQRPPRTPFSELEFNVATPTDTAKSRRVSFSRRTDVAEFVTNEATTTWKTMYVEQNRSLESSGNDSAMNPPRPTVCHLGKRIFDQQFQEVEAVDSGAVPHANPRVRDMDMSLMNVDFAQQIAEMERDDASLAPPQQNFELSSCTEYRSKLFGDFTMPSVGAMSGKVDVDLFVIQPVGGSQKCDDLDEIQRDLQRSQPAAIRCGPFADAPNTSDYIEVDLNTTHVGLKRDTSDMSITDTIRSPKDKSLPQLYVPAKVKPGAEEDCVVDKENIAINPYAAPKESANFAINEIPDQVLVFDGRRLTIQTERKTGFGEEDAGCRRPLSNQPSVSQRKTIVLNVNDDLPNFIDDAPLHGLRTRGIEYDGAVDGSIPCKPQAVPNAMRYGPNSHNTVLYEGDDVANVSMTQAIPTNILAQNEKRRTTIVFDSDAELSMTQAVLAPLKDSVEQNKTVVFGADDISFTQAVPGNVLVTDEIEKGGRGSVPHGGNDFDISFTQALPNNVLLTNTCGSKKWNTIVYGDDVGDVSITRVLPSNIIISDGRGTVEAMQGRKSLKSEKSIVYEKDGCDISMTEAVPKNIILSDAMKSNDTKVVYGHSDDHNISETKMVPTNIVEYDRLLEVSAKEEYKDGKIIVDGCEKLATNMSITQAIPENVFLAHVMEKRKSLVNGSGVCDVLVTQSLPTDKSLANRSAIANNLDLSITQAVPDNIVILNVVLNTDTRQRHNETRAEETQTETQKSCIEHDVSSKSCSPNEDLCKSDMNMSITQAIQTNEAPQESRVPNDRCETLSDEDMNISMTDLRPTDILLNGSRQVDDKMIETTTVNVSSDTMYCKERELDAPSFTKSICSKSMPPEEKYNSLSHKAEICKEDSVAHVLELSNSEYTNMKAEINGTHSAALLDKSPKLVSEEKVLHTSEKCAGMSQSFGTNNAHKSAAEINYQDLFVYQAATEHNVSMQQLMNREPSDLGIKMPLASDSPKRSDINLAEDSKEPISSLENSRTSQKRPGKSILSELLKMSDESINISDDGVGEKNAMVEAQSIDFAEHIPKDHPETLRTDDELLECKFNKTLQVSQPNIESNMLEECKSNKTYAEVSRSNSEMFRENNSQERVENKSPVTETLYENVLSVNYERTHLNESPKHSSETLCSDLETEEKDEITTAVTKTGSEHQTYKQADDTKELLEMLSDFTDKTMIKQSKDKDDANVPNEHGAVEENSNGNGLKRLSFAKSRMSIVLSREDLLTNISIAQAALQARADTDESDDDDTLDDTPEDPIEAIDVVEEIEAAHEEDQINRVVEETNNKRKSIRVSTEVVKTLQFDDSAIDTIQKSAENLSPLRKNVYGDNVGAIDGKAKVIPSYLKDVSEDVKSLMQDLVKPTADQTSFGRTTLDRPEKGESSTRSINIQANIITSSQIDIDIESESDVSTSVCKTDRKSVHLNQSKLVDSEPVLIFDHANPLNNVLLSPTGKRDTHKYRPEDTASSKTEVEPMSCLMKSVLEKNADERVSIQRISTHYDINTSPVRDGLGQEPAENASLDPNDNPALPANTSEEPQERLKDTEVNTSISMKCNKVLLEETSCLTLVDDEEQGTIVEDTQQAHTTPAEAMLERTSPRGFGPEDASKPKKRTYSSAKREPTGKAALSSPDVTPKPLSKIQKVSNSPRVKPPADAAAAESERSLSRTLKRQPKCNPSKSGKPKFGSTVIVQQLTAECGVEMTERDGEGEIVKEGDSATSGQSSCSTLKTETMSRKNLKEGTSGDMSSSFTSRAQSAASRTSKEVGCAQSEVSPLNWCAKLDHRESNVLADCESSINVLAKIDALSFMGGHDCEWDWSDVDTWRFRLMRGRLRLTVRLERVRSGASDARFHARGYVAADTPVLSATVELAHEDADPLARTCARLACEAMRYECARVGAAARDVAALLRRCAAVARLARRWARVMRDARAHLAFTIAGDGALALKVANIPLRSVYEVTLRIELVVEDLREAAWARAGRVRVRDVTSGHARDAKHAGDVTAGQVGHAGDAEGVHARDLQRILARVPHDWGHVPRTLWKVFRHLKNKTKDDELLGI
ncbi:unnamed protein product, partial [Iphiclides podalirius]